MVRDKEDVESSYKFIFEKIILIEDLFEISKGEVRRFMEEVIVL